MLELQNITRTTSAVLNYGTFPWKTYKQMKYACKLNTLVDFSPKWRSHEVAPYQGQKGALCHPWARHSQTSSCEVSQTWRMPVYSSMLSHCSVAAAMTTCPANIFPIQLNAWLSLPARDSLKKKKEAVISSFSSFSDDASGTRQLSTRLPASTMFHVACSCWFKRFLRLSWVTPEPVFHL